MQRKASTARLHTAEKTEYFSSKLWAILNEAHWIGRDSESDWPYLDLDRQRSEAKSLRFYFLHVNQYSRLVDSYSFNGKFPRLKAQKDHLVPQVMMGKFILFQFK